MAREVAWGTDKARTHSAEHRRQSGGRTSENGQRRRKRHPRNRTGSTQPPTGEGAKRRRRGGSPKRKQRTGNTHPPTKGVPEATATTSDRGRTLGAAPSAIATVWQSRNGSAVGRLSPPRKPRKWRGRAVRTARGHSAHVLDKASRLCRSPARTRGVPAL